MSQNTLDDVYIYIYIWTISFDIIYRTIFGALAFNFDLSSGLTGRKATSQTREAGSTSQLL